MIFWNNIFVSYPSKTDVTWIHSSYYGLLRQVKTYQNVHGNYSWSIIHYLAIDLYAKCVRERAEIFSETALKSTGGERSILKRYSKDFGRVFQTTDSDLQGLYLFQEKTEIYLLWLEYKYKNDNLGGLFNTVL